MKSTEALKKKVVICGAGIGGLALSIRLKKKGYNVSIIEKNHFVGGKLSESWVGPYRFDMGPSVMTLPGLVDDLIADVGLEAKFVRSRIEEPSRYIYHDGLELRLPSSLDLCLAMVAEKFPDDLEGAKKLLGRSKKIYETVAPIFLHRSLQKISTYLRPQTWLAFLKLPFLGIGLSLYDFVKKYIKNEALAQIFTRYATFNGSSPYRARGIYSLISHVDLALGLYAPVGGMHQLTKILEEGVKKSGINLVLSERVEEIVVKDSRVTGVRTDKNVYETDFFVANTDVRNVYSAMLTDPKLTKKEEKRERACSGIVFYWGVNKVFQELSIHNTFFGSDYKAEFEGIFDSRSLVKDPTIYVNISSRYSKSDAPEGHDAWFVMINAPSNDGSQDWDETVARARQFAIKRIGAHLGVDLAQHIVCESILDPRLIEERYGAYQGSIYGSSSNALLSAFFRQGNKSKKYRGLYFVGGSAHPGGGIPLCLLSAKICSDYFSEVKDKDHHD